MLNVLSFKIMYITPCDVVESLVAAAISASSQREAAIYAKILPIAVTLTYC